MPERDPFTWGLEEGRRWKRGERQSATADMAEDPTAMAAHLFNPYDGRSKDGRKWKAGFNAGVEELHSSPAGAEPAPT